MSDRSIFDKNMDQLTRLTSFDQLDAKFILLTMFLKLDEMQANPEAEPAIIENYILTMNAKIPPSMADSQFKEESAAAYNKVIEDQRREWCGRKAGKKRFEDEDGGRLKKNQIEVKVLDPVKLLAAIVGLFDRSGMWLRKSPKTLIGAREDEEAKLD